MIRMQTSQLWDLIYQDKKLKQELEEQLKEVRTKRDNCYAIFLEQFKVVQKIQDEEKKIMKNIQEHEDTILKFHHRISMLEIQIIMAEKRKNKILKALQTCQDEARKVKFLKELQSVTNDIGTYQSKQEELRSHIHLEEKEIEKETKQRKEKQKRLSEEKQQLVTCEKNVAEWDIELETKQNVFYQNTFEKLNENYHLLQEFVVRNIQGKKKITKEEAKKKTDAVIFENEETISIDPPGKVRRLTKYEKEKLSNVEEL